MTTEDTMDYLEKPDIGTLDINLKKVYPPAFRSIIRDILPWILGLPIIAVVGLLIYSAPASMATETQQVFRHLFTLATVIYLICVAGVTLYAILFRLSYAYGIKNGHFFMSRGIILRHQGSYPLIRITDVFLDRDVMDVIFGLYNLHISTPTTESANIASIRGLSHLTAHAMQGRLIKLMNENQTYADKVRHLNQDVVTHSEIRRAKAFNQQFAN